MAMYNLSSHLSAKGLGQTFNGFPGSLETKAASGEEHLRLLQESPLSLQKQEKNSF
jgi:hypothetical protein